MENFILTVQLLGTDKKFKESKMTEEQWEQAYWECCKRDFANKIYKECEKEDLWQNI